MFWKIHSSKSLEVVTPVGPRSASHGSRGKGGGQGQHRMGGGLGEAVHHRSLVGSGCGRALVAEEPLCQNELKAISFLDVTWFQRCFEIKVGRSFVGIEKKAGKQSTCNGSVHHYMSKDHKDLSTRM